MSNARSSSDDADMAVEQLLAGELNFDSEATCDHHGEHQSQSYRKVRFGGDTVLDNPTALSRQLVEGDEEAALYLAFGHHRRGAMVFSLVFVVSLVDFLAAGLVVLVVAPDLFSVVTPALAANNLSRERVATPPDTRERISADNLSLNGVPLVRLDDRLMRMLYPVLRNIAFVHLELFG